MTRRLCIEEAQKSLTEGRSFLCILGKDRSFVIANFDYLALADRRPCGDPFPNAPAAFHSALAGCALCPARFLLHACGRLCAVLPARQRGVLPASLCAAWRLSPGELYCPCLAGETISKPLYSDPLYMDESVMEGYRSVSGSLARQLCVL
jgi:hypothetical protein